MAPKRETKAAKAKRLAKNARARELRALKAAKKEAARLAKNKAARDKRAAVRAAKEKAEADRIARNKRQRERRREKRIDRTTKETEDAFAKAEEETVAIALWPRLDDFAHATLLAHETAAKKGLVNVRYVEPYFYAEDIFGTEYIGYTVYAEDTGRTRFLWGRKKRIQPDKYVLYTPKTFKDRYGIPAEEYTVRFAFGKESKSYGGSRKVANVLQLDSMTVRRLSRMQREDPH